MKAFSVITQFKNADYKECKYVYIINKGFILYMYFLFIEDPCTILLGWQQIMLDNHKDIFSVLIQAKLI